MNEQRAYWLWNLNHSGTRPSGPNSVPKVSMACSLRLDRDHEIVLCSAYIERTTVEILI